MVQCVCLTLMYPHTHKAKKIFFKTDALLPCIYFLFYSEILVMSHEIHFATCLRAMTYSLKKHSSECSDACLWYLFTSFLLGQNHKWKDGNKCLGGQLWPWSAWAPLSSSSLVLAGPLGQPQAYGCLPACRVGVLGAGRDSCVMSTLYLTAHPFLTTVSSNKNVSKQGEFSVFIAAIEKIM